MELEQLKHSLSTKSVTANKITSKFKKLCQMLWLLKKKQKQLVRQMIET